MISLHSSYTVRLEPGQTFYYCRRYEPLGVSPQVALPQHFHSWIARLLHGSYILNCVTGQAPQTPIEFRTTGACSFVAWKLRDGEEICFDGGKLAGFEKSITLRTLISFQVSALCLDRIFFQIARGPGLMLFETSGTPEIFHEVSSSSFPPSRLVCWKLDSTFEIDASPKVMDHYFSAAYLRTIRTSGLVIDANDTSKRSGGFLWNLIKRVYRPL